MKTGQRDFPLPMQYLGSKQRIADWILDEISLAFPETNALIDLMSGSGAMSDAANRRGWAIFANDIQPYSFSISKSAFDSERDGLQILIDQLESGLIQTLLTSGERAFAAPLLEVEERFFQSREWGKIDWKEYANFSNTYCGDPSAAKGPYDLFSRYYPNTYFGVRQCLEIDAIRQVADTLQENVSRHLIAALVSTLTFVASTTTHLAQYLKPSSEGTAKNLLSKRQASITDEVLKRLYALLDYPLPMRRQIQNQSFEEALMKLHLQDESAVVYADPPYFKEHYSRYYHVLDTAVLYDYPDLTFNPRINGFTVGRYRKSRIVSDFGLKSQVGHAFEEMFVRSRAINLDIALSYANTSLLPASKITSIAESCGYKVTLKEKALRHSGQGQVRTKQNVIEYLFLLSKA